MLSDTWGVTTKGIDCYLFLLKIFSFICILLLLNSISLSCYLFLLGQFFQFIFPLATKILNFFCPSTPHLLVYLFIFYLFFLFVVFVRHFCLLFQLFINISVSHNASLSSSCSVLFAAAVITIMMNLKYISKWLPPPFWNPLWRSAFKFNWPSASF